MAERFADRLEGVLVQKMAHEGVEVLCGITQEPVFGPLVVFGLGGVDVLGDTGARLTPLTDLRLSRLAEDHPDIAELDLNPVIARPDGVLAVDVRVRVIPQRHWDPYLRRLTTARVEDLGGLEPWCVTGARPPSALVS